MEIISSKQNEKIKDINKLKTSRGRKKQGKYLIESWHLVDEAIKNLPKGQIAAILLTDEQFQKYRKQLDGFDVTVISADIARELSDTKTSQNVFAVCKITGEDVNWEETGGAWLFLDDVQDPGNIGTMVRSADAAGFSGVLLGEGCVSKYNPKLIRSMQGSQFHLPVVSGNVAVVVKIFKARNIPVLGSELNPKAVDYKTVKPMNEFALIMGNEGNGMSKNLLEMTDQNLYIPIAGKAESLNVAVACAVLMFRIKKG